MTEVLIPFKRPGLLFSLASFLSVPEVGRLFRFILRDEGDPSPFDAYNQVLIDALSRAADVFVFRATRPSGVLRARHDLVMAARTENVVWLDSDLYLPQATIELLRDTYTGPVTSWAVNHFAVQGCKYETYVGRKYAGDINQLGSTLTLKSPGEIREMLRPTPNYFCDMALAVMKRAALVNLDWSAVLKGDTANLAGEDALISGLLAADGGGLLKVFYEPRLLGFHLAGLNFRWDWERPTDLLMQETLRRHGVDEAIVKGLYEPAV